MTCPSCGLHNEPGARVCRNCGLPVASAVDPLRGVIRRRIEMPAARGSGVSATVGLVAVVAVFLVAGTLAVSGDGILSRGGLLGGALPGDPSPAPGAGEEEPSGTDDPGSGPAVVGPGEQGEDAVRIGAVTDYSCEGLAIRDSNKTRWQLATPVAGPRDEGYDRVTLSLTRVGKAKAGTTLRGEWLTPKDASERFGIDRPAGSRVLALTFEGPVALTSNQTISASDLDTEGVEAIRSVQVFASEEDGLTRLVVGIKGDGCARMQSRQWKEKGADSKATIFVDVQDR